MKVITSIENFDPRARSKRQVLNPYVFEGDSQVKTMMRTLLASFLTIVVILLSVPLGHAQDLFQVSKLFVSE